MKTMRFPGWFAAALSLLAALHAPPMARATTFDAANDFSATQNPSGRWSYGYRTTLATAFAAYTTHTQRGAGIDFWDQGTDDPTIGHNGTGAPAAAFGYDLDTNKMVMGPGSGGELTVLRWRAPHAGTYTIHVDWVGLGVGGGSPATTDAYVLVNDVVQNDSAFPKQIRGTGSTASYDTTLTLALGDRVEFALDYGASSPSPDYIADSTGIDVTIQGAGGDGSILYTRGAHELVLMEADGTLKTPLIDGTLNTSTGNSFSVLACALSSDGYAAAFADFTGGIYVMKAEPETASGGGNFPVNVIDGAPVTWNFGSGIAWSPNGRHLVFQGSDMHLYVLAARDSGGNITPFNASTNPLIDVATSGSTAPNPVWSPDGKHLARIEGTVIQVFPVTDSNGAITAETFASSVALSLQNDGFTQKNSIAWSSDGRKIAFVETSFSGGEKSRVVLLDARDTAGALTPESVSNARVPLYAYTATPLAKSVSWSPDGALLAVSATDSGVENVDTILPAIVDGSNPRVPVTTTGDGGGSAAVFAQGLALPTPDFTLDSDIDTQLPYSSANPWTFKARLVQPLPPSTTVRVQSSTTPETEASWTDIPGGAMDNGGGTAQTWVATTSQVPNPVGIYFRVIAAAPGRADAISVVRGPFPPPNLPTPDFTLDSDISTDLPYSVLNVWTFKARLAQPPALSPDTTVVVQASTDGTNWSDLPDAAMDNNGSDPGIGTAQTWVGTSLQVPAASAVRFRIAARSGMTEKLSVERGPFEIVPPPPIAPITEFDILIGGKKNKTEGVQGKAFKFVARQQDDRFVEGIALRVQFSPNGTSNWQDLPVPALSRPSASALTWALETLRVPAGTVFFRVITSAPGHLDGIGPVSGPFTITAAPILQFDITWESDSDPYKAAMGTEPEHVGGATTHVGEKITYHLIVNNYGDAPVQEAKIKIDVPALTTFVSATGPTDPANPTATTHRINYLLGNIPARTDLIMNGAILRDLVCMVADDADPGDKIGSNNATVRGLNTSSEVANLTTTTVLGPLELTIKRTPSIALPGEFIGYTLTVKNSNAFKIVNVRVRDVLPIGTTFTGAAQFNPSKGDFDGALFSDSTDPLPTNPVITPYLSDGSLRAITWTFPALDPNEEHTMFFLAQVFWDLPVDEVKDGVHVTAEIRNGDYNARATRENSSKEIIAYKSAPSPARTLLSAEPTNPPKLSLTKRSRGATADSHIYFYGVGDVTTVTPGGVFTYELTYSNAAGGAAANRLTLHDEIPVNADYNGQLKLNDVLVTNFTGITFYNLAGQSVAPTDLASIRSFDIDLGNLTAGNSGVFTYEVRAGARAKDGMEINSLSGGYVGDGNKSTRAKTARRGFLLRSRNLSQSVSGAPDILTVLVSEKPRIETLTRQRFVQPGQPSQGDGIRKGEQVRYVIDYKVSGGALYSLRDHKLELVVPRGYSHVSSSFLDSNGNTRAANTAGGAGIGETAPVLGVADKDGDRVLTFGLGSLPGGRKGQVEVRLSAPDPIPDFLKNAAGEVILPLVLPMAHTGNAEKPAAAPESGRERALGGIVSFALDGAKDFTTLPVIGPNYGVGRPFVGIGGPVTVQRGDLVTFTIFYGNYSSNDSVGNAEVGVKVPEGTTFKSASHAVQHNFTASRPSDPQKSVRPEDAEIKTVGGDTFIHWPVLDFHENAGGAVQFTVEVNKNFVGDRLVVDDVYFTARDANSKAIGNGCTPGGPLRVKVRDTGLLAIIGNAIKSFFDGLGYAILGGAEASLRAQENELAQANARTYALSDVQFVHLTNGANVVQLLDGRVLVFGQPGVIGAYDEDIIADDLQGCRVAVGHQSTSSININRVLGPSGIANYTPGDILTSLRSEGTSIVAAGGGNIVAAGGGNLIGGDGASLIGNDAGNFVGTVTPKSVGIVAAGGGNIVAAGGGNLIGQDAAGFVLVAAGGGAIVAAGGGNIVAAGGGNYTITLAATLIGQDAAGIVAAGGGNIVAAGGGNFVSRGGVKVAAAALADITRGKIPAIVAAGGGNLTAKDALKNVNGIVAAGGGNLEAALTGTAVAGKLGNIAEKIRNP